jgi:hypothetical protein
MAAPPSASGMQPQASAAGGLVAASHMQQQQQQQLQQQQLQQQQLQHQQLQQQQQQIKLRALSDYSEFIKWVFGALDEYKVSGHGVVVVSST